MKKGIGLLGVLVLILGMNGVATANVVFDFDSYTTGELNGQDGWSGTDAEVKVSEAAPYGGSGKSLRMGGTEKAAVHDTDQSYTSGTVVVEYANRRVNEGTKSGKMILRNSSDDWLLGVGLDIRDGNDCWLVAHGDGGTQRIYNVALPGTGWFTVRLEVDLDADTADVYWRATDSDPWTTIYTDYAVTANLTIDNIRLENRSSTVGFDEISITPEPAMLSLLAIGGVGSLLRRRK